MNRIKAFFNRILHGRRWEVQTLMWGGWENCWTEYDDKGGEHPWIFKSQREAWDALEEYLWDEQEAVRCGDIEEPSDPSDFRIVEVGYGQYG